MAEVAVALRRLIDGEDMGRARIAGEKNPARVFALVGSTGQLYFIDLEQGRIVPGHGVAP